MTEEKNINKIELTIPTCEGGELKISHTGADLKEVQEVFKTITKYLGFEVEIKQLDKKGGGG